MRTAQILLICIAMSAQSASWHIRAGASGAQTGSDWTDAFTNLPASFTRGDTYYLASGTYAGTKTFSNAESGSSYIHIRKATSADHGSSTGWSDNYTNGAAVFQDTGAGSIWTFNTGFWDIDGATGSAKAGHGIELLSNGTGGGLAISSSFSSGSLAFSRIKIHKPANEGTNQGGVGFSLTATSGSATNIGITNCYDLNMALPVYLYNANEVSIVGSYFVANHSDSTNHTEGISARFSSNVTIKQCWWQDIEGTGWIVLQQGALTNWTIASCVFWHSGDLTISPTGQGVLTDNNAAQTDTVRFWNNTIASVKSHGGLYFDGFSHTNIDCRNNLWIDSDIQSFNVDRWENNGYYTNSTCINAQFGLDTITPVVVGGVSCLCYSSNAPPAYLNCINASGENPVANYTTGDFRITSGTPIGAGQNIGGEASIDFAGVARGASWDLGAFEFASEVVITIGTTTVGTLRSP